MKKITITKKQINSSGKKSMRKRKAISAKSSQSRGRGRGRDGIILEDQSRWDADTLVSAEKIKNDKSRFSKAKHAAAKSSKDILIKAKKEALLLKKVSKQSSTKDK